MKYKDMNNMWSKLFLIVAILLGALQVNAQIAENDTLFHASSANLLQIRTDKKSISIVVKNFDGKGENFYYDVKVSRVCGVNEIISNTYKDISEITIVEIDGKSLDIRFSNSALIPNALSYQIPDPENRTVQSYIGARFHNFGLNLSKKGKSSWSLVSNGLGLGWVTPVNGPAEMNTTMGRSMEWTWAYVLGARWSYGRHSVTMGLGLDWRNYTIKGSRYFHKDENGEISVRPYEAGIYDGHSRLLTFALQVPVLYEVRFGNQKRFGFAAGPVINFNAGGSLKTKYEQDGRKYMIKTGSIGQSPVTVDVMGLIHYRMFGVYARYAPMKVLRTSAGLDFQSFSTGLILMF